MKALVRVFMCATFLLAACETAPQMRKNGEMQEVTVTVWQWNFDPSVIYSRAGERIRIKAHSLDVEHSLTCEELGIDERIPARGGPMKEFEVTVSNPGTFVFLSNLPSGPARGRMMLKIIATR